MIAVFDDAATLSHALAFEAELAKAQASCCVISSEAAREIVRACRESVIDPVELAEEAALAGTLAIPLVQRLRRGLSDDGAAAVHKGATSQDVADTALMRQILMAAHTLGKDLDRIIVALSALAKRYDRTPAVGRTLLQDAVPIGFGLRIAQWCAGIENAGHRLDAEVAANAVIQFGGAAGTRAGVNGKGADIAAYLAHALGLSVGEPWHSRRVGVAAIAAAVGIVIGALGKMARDISLLAQNTVSEAREPRVPGRGGSSAMKHKRNPTGCQIALSAAVRAPGLVAGILAGLPAEQERGLGGWQAEAPAIADLFLLAAGSADAMAAIAEGLEVDEEAIARNLASVGIGGDIGESVAIVAAILEDRRPGKDR
jgi:3-carboxy-cis,cis-muconate cycloisomerase